MGERTATILLTKAGPFPEKRLAFAGRTKLIIPRDPPGLGTDPCVQELSYNKACWLGPGRRAASLLGAGGHGTKSLKQAWASIPVPTRAGRLQPRCLSLWAEGQACGGQCAPTPPLPCLSLPLQRLRAAIPSPLSLAAQGWRAQGFLLPPAPARRFPRRTSTPGEGGPLRCLTALVSLPPRAEIPPWRPF